MILGVEARITGKEIRAATGTNREQANEIAPKCIAKDESAMASPPKGKTARELYDLVS